MIHLDSYISTTDINGLPKIRKRAVQLDQLDVMRDPGFVEIRAEASSALAPLIDKLMFDSTDCQCSWIVYSWRFSHYHQRMGSFWCPSC